MIFNFLKYLRPTWYFNLKPKVDYAYFPTEEILRKSGHAIEIDTGYKSKEAQYRDLAWRAFQLGFISEKPKEGIDVWEKVKLPIADEYRFIRKNYHKVWSIYVLAFRLLTLKNPFREFSGYLKSKKVKREDFSKDYIQYSDYESFESHLIKENPLVSVVIPTLNRYEYLKDVFKDLENQTYKNFEVIVVDQTDDFRDEFYQGWNLDLKYWCQEEKALWKARNEAIKAAKGEYILMSEDDVRFESNLIYEHLKTLDFFNAAASCGVFFPKGSSIPKERNYFKYAEQFATGNALLKREVFKKIGLYDRQFEKQRMGDGEFGLRMYLKGYKSISNPHAFCIDVKAPHGGLRVKGGSWDGWRPKKWNAPRPVPSVLYLSRKYFGENFTKLWIVHSILPSIIPYQFKKNKTLKFLSIFMLPFLFPLIMWQLQKSWRMSGEKLKQGEKIELF